MTAAHTDVLSRAEHDDALDDVPTVERTAAPGRPRDERATRAILEAAIRQLDELGFGRLSLDGVAAEAGVSRATLYRRFRDKADLVTAAVAQRAQPPGELPSNDPRCDLVRFLGAFEEHFGEDCLEVVGGLVGLREETDAMALHRARVVEPRTGYVRALLEQGVAEGSLPADSDVDLLLELLMGGVLARRVFGATPDRRWATRAVAVFWPPAPKPTSTTRRA